MLVTNIFDFSIFLDKKIEELREIVFVGKFDQARCIVLVQFAHDILLVHHDSLITNK